MLKQFNTCSFTGNLTSVQFLEESREVLRIELKHSQGTTSEINVAARIYQASLIENFKQDRFYLGREVTLTGCFNRLTQDPATGEITILLYNVSLFDDGFNYTKGHEDREYIPTKKQRSGAQPCKAEKRKLPDVVAQEMVLS